MGQVNGRRESRALESNSEPPAPVQGAQPSTKTAEFLGFSESISRRRDCPQGQCWRRDRTCLKPHSTPRIIKRCEPWQTR
jgi:hypothetical protein